MSKGSSSTSRRISLPLVMLIMTLVGLGAAVTGLGVGQRAQLMDAVQKRPGQAVRCSLIEVGPPADVAIRRREHGLTLSQDIEMQLGLPQASGLDTEGGMQDQDRATARPAAATSPLRQRTAMACATGPVPAAKPECRVRPAATSARASSNGSSAPAASSTSALDDTVARCNPALWSTRSLPRSSRRLRARSERPNMADQPRIRSASTTASLMSACFVAVISVRVPCLARSRRCCRAAARSGSSSSAR